MTLRTSIFPIIDTRLDLKFLDKSTSTKLDDDEANKVSDVKTPLGYDDSGYAEVQKLHDEAEAVFQSYGEAYSQSEKNLSDSNKSNPESDK
ncbi:unnamed protein product [Phytophthora fragariaefolia]|uniref:Unnamed protein product n=1 Tax=Phytophthora fragariaefolia TaxID=1490495 RepID=A0A9W6Y9R3_9STRA|nr:unnamed protein product [Phytophthora fragariaefolia]